MFDDRGGSRLPKRGVAQISSEISPSPLYSIAFSFRGGYGRGVPSRWKTFDLVQSNGLFLRFLMSIFRAIRGHRGGQVAEKVAKKGDNPIFVRYMAPLSLYSIKFSGSLKKLYGTWYSRRTLVWCRYGRGVPSRWKIVDFLTFKWPKFTLFYVNILGHCRP